MFKKSKIKKSFTAFFLLCALAFLSIAPLVNTINVAFAEGSSEPTNTEQIEAGLNTLGKTAGYKVEGVDENSLAEQIGRYVGVFLSILGIIFIILVIYAGYNWMTAMGDAAKADKAKEILWRAVIGLIIVIGSYAVWGFVYINII